MSTARSTSAPTRTAATGIFGPWVNFWFAPTDPVGLHALRVLSGLLFLFWLLPLAGQQEALFGLGGWFDGRAYQEASRLLGLQRHLFGWSLVYLAGTSSAALTALYWASIVAIALFTLGVATRL